MTDEEEARREGGRPSTSPGANGGGTPQPWRGQAGLEKTGSGRRRVYVPLKRRAARFLEALASCGNVTLARETAGLGKDRVYAHRRGNADFAAAWEAALAAFRARAEAEDDSRAGSGEGLWEALDEDGLVLRRGRGGHVQIVSHRPDQWSKKKEERFLAHLAATGNVEASARAAGVSAKSVWERRQAHAGFRERMEAAREEATGRLEWLLIEEGTNLLSAGAGEKADPQIAMWLLKRRDQAAAGTLKRGAAAERPRSLDEMRESILGKLAAIERHRAAKRLAQGGTEDGEGE